MPLTRDAFATISIITGALCLAACTSSIDRRAAKMIREVPHPRSFRAPVEGYVFDPVACSLEGNTLLLCFVVQGPPDYRSPDPSRIEYVCGHTWLYLRRSPSHDWIRFTDADGAPLDLEITEAPPKFPTHCYSTGSEYFVTYQEGHTIEGARAMLVVEAVVHGDARTARYVHIEHPQAIEPFYPVPKSDSISVQSRTYALR